MTRGGIRVVDGSWLPAVVIGIVGSVSSWMISWRVSSERAQVRAQDEIAAARERTDDDIQSAKERTDGLRQELRDHREEWREGHNRLLASIAVSEKLQAAQEVVNRVTAQAIEGITQKLDRHDEKLNDLTATLKLVTELCTRRHPD